jgi:hypothetical protein
MSLSDSLTVALKEWHSVCRALGSGRQTILLRKGGIYESAGEFVLQHRQFVFFPTFVHQKLEMLKDDAHADFAPHTNEPANITLDVAGEVTDIIELTNRAQMDRLDREHIWTPPLIDMRFNYRPENPLYLLIVRAYRLHEPATMQNTVAYVGCKSWVTLARPIESRGATPALSDLAFETRRQSIRTAMV